MAKPHNAWLFALALVAPAAAQISGLAANYDGSVLYFSSTHSLRGSGQQQYEKIFRWQDGTLQVFAYRERGPSGDGAYRLYSPFVSADGTSVAYSSVGLCAIFCGSTWDRYRGTVQNQDGSRGVEGVGLARISRNGRYVLLMPELSFSPQLTPLGFVNPLVMDPANSGLPVSLAKGCFGFSWRPDCLSYDGRQVLTNAGTVLRLGDGLVLDDGRAARLVATSVRPGAAAISPEGDIAIYESLPVADQPRQLKSVNLAGGNETLLFYDPRPRLSSDPADPYRSQFEAVLSDDGRLVLALPIDNPGELRQWLFTIGTDSSNPNWFGYEAEGYVEATLSGDGRFAFAVTPSDRLVRFDLTSGGVTELLPRQPRILQVRDALIAGSLNRIRGLNLGAESASPVVEYNGQTAALLNAAPDELTVQIPWEADLPKCWWGPRGSLIDNVRVRVDTPHEGPFESPELFVPACYLQQVPQAFEPAAVHADGAPVSEFEPVRPREDLRLFFTGVGPVEPAVPTGAPAPQDPPARLVSSIQCECRGAGAAVPVDVPFAGLAPGLIGVHQIDIRVPADLPGGPLDGSRVALQCTAQATFGVTLPFAYTGCDYPPASARDACTRASSGK